MSQNNINPVNRVAQNYQNGTNGTTTMETWSWKYDNEEKVVHHVHMWMFSFQARIEA